MTRYVIKATISTSAPDDDLKRLADIFRDRLCAEVEALPSTNWEEVYDGYETEV